MWSACSSYTSVQEGVEVVDVDQQAEPYDNGSKRDRVKESNAVKTS